MNVWPDFHRSNSKQRTWLWLRLIIDSGRTEIPNKNRPTWREILWNGHSSDWARGIWSEGKLQNTVSIWVNVSDWLYSRLLRVDQVAPAPVSEPVDCRFRNKRANHSATASQHVLPWALNASEHAYFTIIMKIDIRRLPGHWLEGGIQSHWRHQDLVRMQPIISELSNPRNKVIYNPSQWYWRSRRKTFCPSTST